jgi:hypothetical protein
MPPAFFFWFLLNHSGRVLKVNIAKPLKLGEKSRAIWNVDRDEYEEIKGNYLSATLHHRLVFPLHGSRMCFFILTDGDSSSSAVESSSKSE